jgi:hypothetical protein
MKRVSSPNLNTRLPWLTLTMLGATFVATLSGCPGGADLEHPEKYFPEATGAMGGTAGTGGTGAAGGGSGGKAPMEVPVPLVEGCDIPTVLTDSCATNGCHKPGPIMAAKLNLIADNGLVGRVKDVPSTHSDLYCGNVPCPTIPAECPVDDKLVDSTDYTQSWIVKKMNDPAGCGELMPISTTFTGEEKLCIENLVKAIAALP